MPDLPGVRDGLPVRRAVRSHHRPRPRAGGGACAAVRRSAASPGDRSAVGDGVFSALLRAAAVRGRCPPDCAPAPGSAVAQRTLVEQHARRVILLEGCVQPGLAPQINAATARVLDRLGISVVRARDEACCGALGHHLGRTGRSSRHVAMSRHAPTARRRCGVRREHGERVRPHGEGLRQAAGRRSPCSQRARSE